MKKVRKRKVSIKLYFRKELHKSTTYKEEEGGTVGMECCFCIRTNKINILLIVLFRGGLFYFIRGL